MFDALTVDTVELIGFVAGAEHDLQGLSGPRTPTQQERRGAPCLASQWVWVPRKQVKRHKLECNVSRCIASKSCML